MTSSASRRDSLVQRAAELLRGSDRAERLGSALARMARELAVARRQIAILERENAARRAQLDAGGRTETAARNGRRPPNHPQPKAGMGGGRRG
jgi:septal ring factor EnvC (AmiA/AmiB activator)